MAAVYSPSSPPSSPPTFGFASPEHTPPTACAPNICQPLARRVTRTATVVKSDTLSKTDGLKLTLLQRFDQCKQDKSKHDDDAAAPKKLNLTFPYDTSDYATGAASAAGTSTAAVTSGVRGLYVDVNSAFVMPNSPPHVVAVTPPHTKHPSSFTLDPPAKAALFTIAPGDHQRVNALLQKHELNFTALSPYHAQFDLMGATITQIEVNGVVIASADCARYFSAAERIALTSCTFTDKAESLFKHWGKASNVSLTGSIGIQHVLLGISQLVGITHLNLNCCKQKKLTDDTALHLSKLVNLTELHIVQSDFYSSGLAQLAALKKLAHLDISQTKVGDLAPLLAFPGLAALSMRRNDAVFEAENNLTKLAALKQLHTLDLQNNQKLLDTHLVQLAAIPTLTHLNLIGCNSITYQGCRTLCQTHAQFKELQLCASENLTEAQLLQLQAEFSFIKITTF